MPIAKDVNEYLVDASTRQDPYPLLAGLREEHGGVVRTDVGPWLVISHDESRKAYLDKRVSRWQAALHEMAPENAPTPEIRRAIEATRQMLINRDGADHARLRTLVMAAFLPSALLKWKEKIDHTVVELIDKVVDKDEYDFRTEVGFPLPEIVICEMLGVPHSDHDKWSAWSGATVALNRAATPSAENLRAAQEANLAFYHYFLEMIEERKANPGDDLLSLLINARDANDRLSTDEVIGTAQMLIAAGHETTANLITNMMHFLVTHPDQLQRLKDDPSRIPDAVQEAVRLFSPAHMGLPRVTTEEMTLGNTTLPAGSPLLVVWAAANRDPAVFDRPDEFDIDRPNLDRQTGFAFGPHVCIGRRLAEMEAIRMMEEIVSRLPVYELVDEPQIAASFTRGYTSLRLRKKR